MKKYLLSGLAVTGLMLFSAGAQALDFSKPYVVGGAGYSFGIKNTGDAGLVEIGTGYHLNEFLRGDITAGYRGWGKVNMRSEPASKTDVWSIPLLANLYMTIPVHQKFSLYGMGGIGMAWNTTDDLNDAKGSTKYNFAWTAGGGIDYYVNTCMSFDLGYRYTDLGEARVKDRGTYVGRRNSDMRSHDIKLSARYYF